MRYSVLATIVYVGVTVVAGIRAHSLACCRRQDTM